jgi:hypothetical protein
MTYQVICFFLDFRFKYISNFIFLLKVILNLSIAKIFCDQFSIKVLFSSYHPFMKQRNKSLSTSH